MSEVVAFVDSIVNNNLIAIFGYTNLPTCSSVFDNVSLLNIRYGMTLIDLEDFDQEEAIEIREYLYKITGRYDMPFVFFKQKDIPCEIHPDYKQFLIINIGDFGIDKGDFYFSEIQKRYNDHIS